MKGRDSILIQGILILMPLNWTLKRVRQVSIRIWLAATVNIINLFDHQNLNGMVFGISQNELLCFLIKHSPGTMKGLKGEFSSSPSSCSSSSSSSLGCAPSPVSCPASLLLSLSPSSGWLSPSVTTPFSLPHDSLAARPSSPECSPSSGPTRARISLCLCGGGGSNKWRKLKKNTRRSEKHCGWVMEMT